MKIYQDNLGQKNFEQKYSCENLGRYFKSKELKNILPGVSHQLRATGLQWNCRDLQNSNCEGEYEISLGSYYILLRRDNLKVLKSGLRRSGGDCLPDCLRNRMLHRAKGDRSHFCLSFLRLLQCHCFHIRIMIR